MKLLKSIALSGALAGSLLHGLTGCSEGNVGNDGDENTVRAEAALNLKTGIAPLPIDLFFAGSDDGTLNIPNPSGNPAVTAVNLLDGWSTTANISVPFTQDIDPNTLNGNTVLLFKVTTAEVAPGGVTLIPPPPASQGMQPQQLQYGVDYFAEVSPAEADGAVDTTMLIHPLKPLEPKSGYLVVLVSNLPTPAGPFGIATPDGIQMQSSGVFQLLKDFVDPSNPSANRFYRLPGDPDHTGDPSQDTTQLALDNNIFPSDAETFEGIRRLYVSILGVTDTFLPRQSVLQAWTFSTQSTTDVMEVVNDLSATEAKTSFIVPVPNGQGGVLNTSNIPDTTLPGLANLHIGYIDLPYYLERAASPNDPTPISSFWLGDPAISTADSPLVNPFDCYYLGDGSSAPVPKPSSNALTRCNASPVRRSIERVPMLVTVPNANSGQPEPMDGWPVVIFQHGITRNRLDAIAVADRLAFAGFVVIAIDQPLHGVTDTTNNFYQNGSLGIPERTFDLDITNNTTGAPGPDGTIDASGSLYIQLASTLTSRDNLRQSAADIIHLAKTAVAGMDLNAVDGNPTNDLDSSRIYFLGHSLGGIAGTTALGVNDDLQSATLAMSGGGIGKLLDGSGSFGPRIAAGLAAQGVNEGTETYESFLRLAQTAADAGDAINFAAAANSADRGILLFKVVGDDTVPNNVVNNPQAIVDGWLAGTDPVVEAMMLPEITANAEVQSPATIDGLRVFTEGDHGSILDPTTSEDTTTEMQCEAAEFFKSDGSDIDVDNCAQ